MRTALLLSLLPIGFLLGCAVDQGSLRIESPYREPTTLAKGDILHLKTGRLLSQTELLDYLAQFPVVYVGESHDSLDDHGVELAVLEGLAQRFPGKLALGLEMLRRPSQVKVDDYIQGRSDEKEFLRVWQENWGNTFPYYRDILRFARDNKLPLLALNAGNDLKSAVREKGLEGLPPEMAEQLPAMDFDDPYHRAFIEGMMGGHAKGSKDPSVFYRIQVLWDETMAQTAADFLQSPEGQGRRLVVFAGGNHVRYGFGIPRRVFRRAPVPYVIVEPYVNTALVAVPAEKTMDVEIPALPMPSADVYWSVDYRDLEDQRVMLGVQIEEADKKGVRVVGVLPGSPGEKAGLRSGDVIVSVDRTGIKEVFDLTYQVSLHKPGDVGPLEVLRGGEPVPLQVTYDVVKHGE
ncbi:MAG: ChaN family lipoprotein [Deltaproteobacteria bacterium]|nr:ChaN family lipoprotein [Deltaproteobacteria bacterium]